LDSQLVPGRGGKLITADADQFHIVGSQAGDGGLLRHHAESDLRQVITIANVSDPEPCSAPVILPRAGRIYDLQHRGIILQLDYTASQSQTSK
jgi:hypothetical protein